MSEETTRGGIAARAREALDTAGITPARFAGELAGIGADAEDLLSGARPFSSFWLAVVAELTGETVEFLVTGQRPAIWISGPCRMPGEA